MGGAGMPITRLNTREIVKQVGCSLQAGRGLLPLVGSGLSVESGIPTGERLLPYLRRVMRWCLHEQYDLDKAGWPPLTEVDRPVEPDPGAATRNDAIAATFVARASSPSPRAHGEDRSERRTHVAEEAARADGRWNAMLVLLSRLKRSEEPAVKLWLSKPSSHTIDAFGHLLTRGAHFNFGHAMLAQLARAARIRTVLTTNFDALLEDAFRRVRLDLDVYEVPLQGSLPDHRMVSTQPALIKLHGGRVGIRVDHTLDYSPDSDDVYTFAAYLSGLRLAPDPDPEVFRDSVDTSGNLTMIRDLLVLGFGGRDLRIMQLVTQALYVIRRASEASAPIPDVFWICHNHTDEMQLQDTLDRLEVRQEEQSRFRVTVEDAQILLHELYTSLTGTVPSRGLDCDFIRDIAPEPRQRVADSTLKPWLELLSRKEPRDGGADGRADRTPSGEDAGAARSESSVHSGRLFVPEAPANPVKGASNLSAPAAALYWKLSGQPRPRPDGLSGAARGDETDIPIEGRRCIWVEPSVFASPASLVRGLIARMAARNGRPETGVLRVDTESSTLRSACAHFNISPSDWVIFIYGRDGGGGLDLDWSETSAQSPKPDGTWQFSIERASSRRTTWVSDAWLELERYLLALRDAGFDVVYMPFDEQRYNRFEERFEHLRPGAYHELKIQSQAIPLSSLQVPKTQSRTGFSSEPPPSQRAVLDATMHWALDADCRFRDVELDNIDAPDDGTWRLRKLRFLYALSLCRQFQSRFVLLSNAAVKCVLPFNGHGFDNDVHRCAFVEWCLEELTARSAIRRRPGGFVWMHRDVRLGLQGQLEALKPESSADSATGRTPRPHDPATKPFDALRFKSRHHVQIAEAFEAAHRSTSSHWLMIEELFHLQQAILHADRKWEDAGEARLHALLIERCLIRTLRLLRGARRALERGTDSDLVDALFPEQPPLRIQWRGAPEGWLHRAPSQEQRIVRLYEVYEAEWTRLRSQLRAADQNSKAQNSGFDDVGKLATQGGGAERRDGSARRAEPLRTDARSGEVSAERAQKLDELQVRCLRTRIARSRRDYSRVDGELRAILNDTFLADGPRLLGLLDDLGTGKDFGQVRDGMLAAASQWLHDMPCDGLRNRTVAVATRTLRELVWLRTDELEDRYLPCWIHLHSPATDVTHEPARFREGRPSEIRSPPAVVAASDNRSHRTELRPPPLDQEGHVDLDQEGHVDLKAHVEQQGNAELARNDVAEDFARNREHSLRVCVLANVVHEMSNFLDVEPHLDEDQRAIGVRPYYAQALAYLERFREAHCHLNDAFGRLNRSRFSAHGHYWAFLELRRGAVYLLQAQFQLSRERSRVGKEGSDTDASVRQMLAALDDAWLSFTRARNHLVGGPLTPRHWGRLIAYELRTLAMYPALESLIGSRSIEGLPDRLPGGRLRRALELLQAETALDGGTPERKAQVAHSAYVLLHHEKSPDRRVANRLKALLRGWCATVSVPGSMGSANGDDLRARLDHFVAHVAELIDAGLDDDARSGAQRNPKQSLVVPSNASVTESIDPFEEAEQTE
jgi:hypothetical protein